VPYTTRVPKEGEVDGVDYHFVSRETFESMVAEGKFLEQGEVNGVLYGTSLVGNSRSSARASVSRRIGTAKRSTRPKRFVIHRASEDGASGLTMTMVVRFLTFYAVAVWP
jgi:hypothetical protein